MAPSGFPTGTVSSGRSERPSPTVTRDRAAGVEGDPQARIAELERENRALRAAVEQQRRENERIVERYERLLDCGGVNGGERDDAGGTEKRAQTARESGLLDRAVDLFTYRG